MTDAELHRRARRRAQIAVVAVVIGVALTLLLMWRQQAGVDRELAGVHAELAEARERSDANARAAVANAERLRELGETPPIEPPDSETAPPAVDVAELRPLVREVVAEHMAANPRPRPAELAAAAAVAVSNYLQANPPPRGPRGPGPSAELVARLTAQEVTVYLQANPPPPGRPGADGQDGQDGKDGADGKDGKDATPEMVAEQVRRWFEENPLPVCPTGTAAEPRTVLTTQGPADVVICVVQDEEPPEVPR